ncbi:hypothetical protein [Streptosporangium sp. NPDC051022]|uniref:hypothetical protein n=1 Tax=Streptosporangium sp. NPDC051022 TaxID=3155752 RepID=UPI00343C493A
MNGWRRGRLPWASHGLLLVMLALGIAGMHTLGHPGHGPAREGGPMASGHTLEAGRPAAESRPAFTSTSMSMSMSISAAGPVPVSAPPPVPVPASAPVPTSASVPASVPEQAVPPGRVAASSLSADPGPGDGVPGLDPSSVCLAVLTGLLVLTLSAVASAHARRPREDAAPAAAPPQRAARPPPRRTALRLACLSVLRI